MKTLVIYTSQTGFTKRYAEWISEELNADIYDLKDVKKKTNDFFETYEAIIYAGWCMAGMVVKVKWFFERAAYWKNKKLSIVAVGASPNDNPEVDELRDMPVVVCDMWKATGIFSLQEIYSTKSRKIVDERSLRMYNKIDWKSILDKLWKGPDMKKGERRKQELLRIAYRMFVEKGYENTSIDEIIAEAGIAKGTYYYYFESKEATLEAVIDMMIEEEVGRAKEILAASLPIPQKLVSVIYSLRPAQGEQGIVNALNVKENIVMHEKVNRRIVEEAVPLLTEIVKEGISQGMLSCNNIEERVKMLLIISQHTFDDGDFSDRDVEVYIDMVEKTFGAEAGTMNFIRELISGGQRSE